MSDKINKNVDKFLKYMQRPLSLPALELIYASNNIVFERADLYRDFILTLNDTVFKTYLGDEHTNEEEKINHFNWCWNTVSDNLSHGNITFKDNEDVHVYFINFYFDTFYDVDKNNESELSNNIHEVWRLIFNYNIEKPRTDLDTFLTLYRVFEKSYKKQ